MRCESSLYVQTLAHSAWPSQVIHFACQFEILRSGVRQILRREPAQYFGTYFRFAIFRFWLLRSGMQSKLNFFPRHSHTAPCRKKLRHFACQLGVLGSGYRKSEKCGRILKSTGIWHFFQIHKIFPLLSVPNRHVKCHCFFHQALWGPVWGERGSAGRGAIMPLHTRNTQKHLQIQVYIFSNDISLKKPFFHKILKI
jgi:hypothetical protein